MNQELFDQLLDILAKVPLTSIAYEYSGSGDSGSFESPAGFFGEHEEPLFISNLTTAELIGHGLEGLSTEVPWTQRRWDSKAGFWREEPIKLPLLEALTEWAHRMPLGNYANNDGGQGTVTFYPKERRVAVHHGDNVMITEWSDAEVQHSEVGESDWEGVNHE